jgi:hypothetical protein
MPVDDGRTVNVRPVGPEFFQKSLARFVITLEIAVGLGHGNSLEIGQDLMELLPNKILKYSPNYRVSSVGNNLHNS